MQHPKLWFSATIAIILFSTGCSPRAGKQQRSELDFAHYPADNSIGGVLGRIMLMKSKLPETNTSVTVCVESRVSTMSLSAILLETRLAIIAWLDASGTLTDEDWNRFEFFSAVSCTGNDDVDSYVRFPALTDEKIDSRFEQQILNCTKTGNKGVCQLSNITLGFGGPGSTKRWTQPPANNWTKIEFTSSATAEFSPYVSWISIADDIASRDNTVVSAALQKEIVAEYTRLADEPKPTRAELLKFLQPFKELRLLALVDLAWKKRLTEFVNGSNEKLSEPFSARVAVFPTLLHEIGHQMGMDHAHHPGQDSVVGSSTTTTKNAAGTWVTDDAAMSYGLPFLFLTEDDTAGATSLAKALQQLFDEKIK